jgi:hypothetical protein
VEFSVWTWQALSVRALEAERNFCSARSVSARSDDAGLRGLLHHLFATLLIFNNRGDDARANRRWFARHIDTEDCNTWKRPRVPGSVIVAGFHFSATKLLTLLLMRYGYDTTQYGCRTELDKSVVERRAEYRKIDLISEGSDIPDFTLPSYRRSRAPPGRRGSGLVRSVLPQKQEFQEQASKVFGYRFQSGLNQSRLKWTSAASPCT